MKPLSELENNIKLYRPLLDIKKKFLIKISKLTFGKYFKDPSNKDKKYLRTKIRDLKKPLSKSGIDYEQIIKSINNLASSKETLDEYFNIIFRDTVKKQKNKISINLKKFHNFNEEIRMMLINKSIKVLKKNYYNPRSKKVINLIKEIEKNKYLKSTLGGCIISKKSNILYLTNRKKVTFFEDFRCLFVLFTTH
jgi:tRNA(Ile)-lysidine synthase